jgi:tetratricopeptide (TPR) repeat protein
MTPELSPDQWQRLEALFEIAAELPAGEREAFVARETAGDPRLASRLAGMLGQGTDAGDLIAGIVGAAAVRVAPESTWIGRRLGPYRIVREIGRGGMGLVFEAVRDDAEYQMRVALKVAPWWHDTPAVRDRFRHERQMLAALEHPNIARFLDGGTEAGVPYFVMEYVEGRLITQFCDDERLSLRQRLALFRLVCQAVHFAHEHLIVHRDLKPANILVADNGAPKLLDFGIAKLIDPVADPSATTGEAIWTPDYTSPEQVRGHSVTTRTDVYSLGLILYELLTGARAQIADPSSPLALDRSICEITPAPPSERARLGGDHDRSRQLRGDLDTIVMMAIRKEPEGRYGSAAALADDLDRYLDGRPVAARPSTVGYRVGKFLRRNKAGTVAAALVGLSVAVGTGGTLYQARRAERRFDQVRSLANTFVFEVHDSIASVPGTTEARKKIVQTALSYLEHLQTEAGGDAALSRELATAYEKVGTVQGDPISANLGDTAGAVDSYGRAERLLTPLAAGGDRAAMRQLASVSRRIAYVHQARGDIQAALAAFDAAHKLTATLSALDPGDAQALALDAVVSSAIARTATTMRDWALAERASQQALEASQRLVVLEPDSTDHRDVLASAHNALGGVRNSTGRPAEAVISFKASIAIREQLVRDEPDNLSWRRTLMISYGNLGDVLGFRTENLNDPAGAVAAFARSAELAEWAMSKDAADQRAPYDLANARLRLGKVLADDPATLARGVEEIRSAQRIIATLLASDPASGRYGFLALVIDLRLADTLARSGRVPEAVVLFERVRSATPQFAKGVNREDARNALVEATIELALIRARTGDRRAEAMAAFVAKELEGPPIGRPVKDAATQGSVGRVYLDLARHTPGEAADLVRRAQISLEKSASRWRAVTLPAEIERLRAEALTALAADIAAANNLLPH